VKEHQTRYSRFCSRRCRALKCSVGIYFAVRAKQRKTRPTPYEKPGYVKLAAAVRARDGYRCIKCGRQFVKGTGRLEVHHKIPIRQGGTDTMDNLE
jgi:5-methylcytosine-specific restriction endonuclease McrA